MDQFNLKNYLLNNKLTKQIGKKPINEAFEGFGGIRGVAPIHEAPVQTKDFNWDPTDSADYDEQSQPNKWIADIDRLQPSYGDWKASWEHPGIIVWSHADIPDAVIVATPGWDGKGTPVEFQSAAGSSQMLKILDQDEFPTFKAYLNAVKPYLDMVLDANVNPTSTDYETSDIKAPGMGEFQGVHEEAEMDENDYFNRRRATDDDMRTMPSSNERIEGLVNQRELAAFGEAVMNIAQDLDDDGFDAEDIKAFLIRKLNDMIIA